MPMSTNLLAWRAVVTKCRPKGGGPPCENAVGRVGLRLKGGWEGGSVCRAGGGGLRPKEIRKPGGEKLLARPALGRDLLPKRRRRASTEAAASLA